MSVKWYCLLQLARPQRLRTRYANVWPHAELERTQNACCMVLFVASFAEPFLFCIPFSFLGVMTVCLIVLHFLSMFWSLSYVCGTPRPSQMIDDLKAFWIHSNSFIPVLLSVWVGLLCFLLFGPLAIDATGWYQLQAKLVPAASLRFKHFTNKHGLTVQVAGVTWQPHVGIPQSFSRSMTIGFNAHNLCSCTDWYLGPR